jgi:hypothetical protein
VKQNYFIYNDNRYEAGTIVVLSRFDYISRRVCDTKVKFLWHDAEAKEYSVEIYGKEYIYTEEFFCDNIIEIYDPNKPIINMHANNVKTHTFLDELNVDGLFIAWMWYVFIMAVGTIFYDRVGIWIFTSIIFFRYRNKKLKEAGYK